MKRRASCGVDIDLDRTGNVAVAGARVTLNRSGPGSRGRWLAGRWIAGRRCLIVFHRPRRHQSGRSKFSPSLLLLPFDLLKPHHHFIDTARQEGRRTTKRRRQGVKLKLETHLSPARASCLQVAWQRKSFFFFTCSMIHPAINQSRMDKAPGDVGTPLSLCSS